MPRAGRSGRRSWQIEDESSPVCTTHFGAKRSCGGDDPPAIGCRDEDLHGVKGPLPMSCPSVVASLLTLTFQQPYAPVRLASDSPSFMTFALRNACALTGRHHSRVRQRACFKSAWRGFGASDWRCPAARGHAASLLTPVQRRLRIRFFRAAKPRGSKASSLLRLKLHPISN